MYNEVKEYFKTYGCVLLEKEYINAHTPMKYLCNCGDVDKKRWNSFKDGQRCRKCGLKKRKNRRKYDYNEVKELFEMEGCILLEKDYIKSSVPMKFKCTCGNIEMISLNCFKRGQRCKNCAGRKRGEALKFSYEYIKSYFEMYDCVLLSRSYVSNNKSLDYICSCGSISKISFRSFSQGTRCRKCGSEKIRKSLNHSYGYVKKYFEERGCVLLSKKYKNAFEIIDYVCVCGGKSKITFNNFQSGHRCYRCGVEKTSEKIKLKYNYVKKYFDEQNCTLLSKKYTNNFTHLNYICECGRKSKASFATFKKGIRCKICSSEKRSGKNSVLWDPNITKEERLIRRNYKKYREWRKKVYKRDWWTCRKCKSRKDGDKYKKINAHHIEGYDNNKELRLSIQNGITLCEKCHREFHKGYGYRNNNKEQFSKFMKKIT